MNRLRHLVLITFGVWLLAALPAGLLGLASPLAVTLIAMAVCLIPAAITLLFIDRLRKRTPEEKMVATMAAPFIRMLLCGTGTAGAYFGIDFVHEHGFGFVGWVIVFYIVTLVVETRLLYIDTTASAEAEPTNR